MTRLNANIKISIYGNTETGALKNTLSNDLSQIATSAMAGTITVSDSKDVDCVMYCIDLSQPIDVSLIKSDIKLKCASESRPPIMLVGVNYIDDTTENYNIFETLVLDDESLNIYSNRLVISATPTHENIRALKGELSDFMEEQAWSTYRFSFLQAIRTQLNDSFSEIFSEQIDVQLTELKEAWKAGSPDFKKFSENCQSIFNSNLPAYQIPSMKNILTKFMMGLFAGIIFSLALSVMLILAANTASLIGLLVVSSVNVKNLTTIATAAGVLGGVAAAWRLFLPRVVAKFETELFTSNFTAAPGV